MIKSSAYIGGTTFRLSARLSDDSNVRVGQLLFGGTIDLLGSGPISAGVERFAA